ncbi:hypothetical protein M513_04619 [Trichuris suis]|uniref:Uncharacterized protein n=1 Tax=Trichuris suis TaxID=68888 RepID=A0A085MB76_9BILA|nr:hypothetical protein M513_04619 [Trichuris suis]
MESRKRKGNAMEEEDGYYGEEKVTYYYDGVYPASASAELSDTVGFYRRKAFKRVLPWAVLTNGMVFGMQLFGFVLLWRLLISYMLMDSGRILDTVQFRTLWFYAIVMMLSIFYCWHALANFQGSFRMRLSSWKSVSLDGLGAYLWGCLLDAFCPILIGNLFFNHTAPSIKLDMNLLYYAGVLSSMILMAAAFMSDHYHVDFSIDYSVAKLFAPSLFISIFRLAMIIWTITMPSYLLFAAPTWASYFHKLFFEPQSYCLFMVIMVNCYRKIALVWMCKRALLQHLAFARLARIALNSEDCNRWGFDWTFWNVVRDACVGEMFNFDNGMYRAYQSLFTQSLSSTQTIRRHYQFPSSIMDSSFDSWSVPMRNYHQYIDPRDTNGIDLGEDKDVYNSDVWTNYQIVIWCAQILCGIVCVSRSASASIDVRPSLTFILSHFFSVLRSLRKHQCLLLEVAANNYYRTTILNLGATVYRQVVAYLRIIRNIYGRDLELLIQNEEDVRMLETM